MVLPVPFPPAQTPRALASSSFSFLDDSDQSGCELVSPCGFHPRVPNTQGCGPPLRTLTGHLQKFSGESFNFIGHAL